MISYEKKNHIVQILSNIHTGKGSNPFFFCLFMHWYPDFWIRTPEIGSHFSAFNCLSLLNEKSNMSTLVI